MRGLGVRAIDIEPLAWGVTPAAFFQQDTNALERISTEFARTIVSSILEAF